MSLKIAAVGVVGAAVLGVALGGHFRPALATRAEGPADSLWSGTGESAPADLTPPYVSPQSLQAWRGAAAPSVAPDRIDLQVRRELAQANADLRASEGALEQYHRAAVLVRNAAEVADRLSSAWAGGDAAGAGAAAESALSLAPPSAPAPVLGEAPAR